MRSNLVERSAVRVAFVLVVLSSLIFIGCDGRPKRYKVSGHVNIDGAPLTHGVIKIVPEGGRASSSAIRDGNFTMRCYEVDDGVIAGTHRVIVNAAEHLSSTKIKWHAPMKYASLGQSGLTATIDSDTEELTFDLTWDGKQPYIEKTGRSGREETSDDI